MGNNTVARAAGFIPRKSYPQVNESHLLGMLVGQGLDVKTSSAIANVLRRVLEKQAIDERLNYTVIEEQLGGGKKYATKVVAASDTPLDDPSQVDYLCTGTDDDNTINTAITAAAGGKVLLLEGHYVCGSGVDNVDVNVAGTTLEGMGYGTYLDFTAGSGSLHLTANNCTVRSVRSKGGSTSDGITVSGDFCKVQSCWGESETGQGISVGGDYSIVAGCTSDGIEATGVFATIVGNESIIVDGNMGIVSTGSLSLIISNYIEATVASDNPHQFALTVSGEGSICEGNIVWASGTGWTAILAGGDEDNLTIRNNIIYLAARHGILVFGKSHNTSVIGNTILGASQEANATYDGIRLDAPNSGDTVNDCFVSNNIVRHLGLTNKPAYGIQIGPTRVNDAFVVGNDLKNSGATAPLLDGGTGTILNYPAHATYGDNRT